MLYSENIKEVLNQEPSQVKPKRVLTEEHKAKMVEGRKKRKEEKKVELDVVEEVVEEVVEKEGVGILPDAVVEKEVDDVVAEILEKKVDDTVAPKWFTAYLKHKETLRKEKEKKKNVAVHPPVAKKGKIIVPTDEPKVHPPTVNHFMKSIFPGRYK